MQGKTVRFTLTILFRLILFRLILAWTVASWGTVNLLLSPFILMIIVKDTERSCVRRDFDGFVHKLYRGQHAMQRLENEVRVLEHLQARGCPFVPRLVAVDRVALEIVQTDCGVAVQRLVDWRLRELFAELNKFGVEHGDCELRNVTYRATDGIFCIVDFEFATILENELIQQLDRLQKQVESELT